MGLLENCSKTLKYVTKEAMYLLKQSAWYLMIIAIFALWHDFWVFCFVFLAVCGLVNIFYYMKHMYWKLANIFPWDNICEQAITVKLPYWYTMLSEMYEILLCSSVEKFWYDSLHVHESVFQFNSGATWMDQMSHVCLSLTELFFSHSWWKTFLITVTLTLN